ncbi:MAG: hypothetical protein ACI93T_001966 [Porticoccaceae bacterium]|jgi:hypothetical protein
MCQYGDFFVSFPGVFRSVRREIPSASLKTIDRWPAKVQEFQAGGGINHRRTSTTWLLDS